MSSTPRLDAPLDDQDRVDPEEGARGNDRKSHGETSPPPSPSSEGMNAVPSMRRGWLYRTISLLLLAVAGGALYQTRPYWQPKVDEWIRPTAGSERRKPGPPVVSVATAQSESVSQFLNCLGTVTAFNSVTIRSRVDGELVEVLIQEGQMVEAGQLLARVDARLFEAVRDQAKGQLQRDLAALELARLNFERTQSLSLGDALSQQERDEVGAIYKQAQAVVDVDRATLANAELQLSYCDILAPIRGRVGLRLVDQGNMIQANDPRGLAVITQLQPIAVLFPIPQDEIPRVQKQLATNDAIPIQAYDRSFQNLLAEGTLSAIDNQVDPTTGTLRLKGVFDNQDGGLFPNQFVNIRLLVRRWDNALVIPSTAIQRGADFLYVYVVQEDSTVELARVTVAFTEGGKSVIESGLEPGQRVVTEGTDKLQPKAKVTLPDETKS